MVYRIVVESVTRWNLAPDNETGREEERLALRGAAWMLSDVMWAINLPGPSCRLENKRTRFYFTERGWQTFGQRIVAEAERRKYAVRVIRRKNPKRSQIIYADRYQIAILPLPWKGRSVRPGSVE